MTIGEVADYLKVTERTIYRLAAAQRQVTEHNEVSTEPRCRPRP